MGGRRRDVRCDLGRGAKALYDRLCRRCPVAVRGVSLQAFAREVRSLGFLGVAPPLWQFLARGGDVAVFLQSSFLRKLRKKEELKGKTVVQACDFIFSERRKVLFGFC